MSLEEKILLLEQAVKNLTEAVSRLEDACEGEEEGEDENV